jgi:hypothetical protein
MRQAAGCLSRLNRFVRSGEGGGSRRNRSERSEQSNTASVAQRSNQTRASLPAQPGDLCSRRNLARIRSPPSSDTGTKGLPPMTVESRPEHAATPAGGPSVHVVRARKLLIGCCAVLDRLQHRLRCQRPDLGRTGGRHGAVLLWSRPVRHGALRRRGCPNAACGVHVQLHRSRCHPGTGLGALQRSPRSLADIDANGHLPDNDHRCRGMVGGRGFCLFSTENRGLRHRVRAAKRR